MSMLRMPLPLPHPVPLMTYSVPQGSQGNTTSWIYGGHIDLQSLPSMNFMKKKQEQSGPKEWRIIRNPNGRDLEVVFLFLSIQRCLGFTVCVCLPPHSKALMTLLNNCGRV